jgi:hypothetical protein
VPKDCRSDGGVGKLASTVYELGGRGDDWVRHRRGGGDGHTQWEAVWCARLKRGRISEDCRKLKEGVRCHM